MPSDLGDSCTVWLHTKLVPVPRELQAGLATSAFKSLSWMARVSGLPSVHAQLQTPLCTAFLTATVAVERREFVVWLERKVMCPDTPMQEALLMGSVLALIWASLRWNDGLWSPPGRLLLDRCHRPGWPPTLRPHWRSLCLLGPVLA